MKRKAVAIFLLLIVFGGAAMLIAGMVVGNGALLYTGIGMTFGGGFVSAVVALVFKFKRVHDRRKSPSSSDDGYIPEDERMMEKVADKWNLSSIADKIKSFLFLGSFITCCVLFVVFASIGKTTWGLIAWGCGMGMMLVAFAIVKIKEHFPSKRQADDRFFEGKGVVLACEEIFREREGEKTAYRVTVEFSGKQASCFCIRSYEKGQCVEILHDKKNDYIMIKE